MVNLVEKLRGIQSRFDIPVSIEELNAFGLNILVFQDNPKEEISWRTPPFETMDSRHLERDLKEEGFSFPEYEDWRKTDLPEEVRDQSWHHYDAYCAAFRDYRDSHPENLREKMQGIDLVVIPERYHDKFRDAFPDAALALISTSEGDIRVTVPDEETIDLETIALLFKRQAPSRDDARSMRWMPDYERGRILARSLYGRFEHHSNPTEKSTYIVNLPRRHSGRSGGRTLEAETVEIPANNFGMGGAQRGYCLSPNKFLEEKRKEKEKKIRELYEDLWTKPLKSVDQIVDRQNLISELIDEPDNASGLAKHLNYMVEPYVHLLNMGRLQTARILKSKWGANVHKQEFYRDFVRFGKEFLEHYEGVRQSLQVESTSREMQMLVSLLGVYFDEEFSETFDFISKAVKTKDYFELEGLFRRELQGASLHKEFEDYTDTDSHEDKGRTLNGYKDDTLFKLQEEFFVQNPVGRGETGINYADFVGSRLVAYLALADFHRDSGWVVPEIASADEGVIEIRQGWYPLMRLQHTEEPVPNDTYMDAERRTEIIDGPNVSGKTVDQKKTFFITTTALAGNRVPAEYAKVSCFDRVRYRLKRTGSHNESALEGELQDAKFPNDTVVLWGLDETFTSTNHPEGESLTYALVRRGDEIPTIRMVITSHYPSLHDLLEDPRVTGAFFSHFEFEERNGGLHFDHLKREGPNQNPDYAIPIAAAEGVPHEIIMHAREHRK